MAGTGLRGRRVVGVVGGIIVVLGLFDEDPGDGVAGGAGQKAGFLADREGHMLVAGTLGFSAPDEILLVNLAASRILVADALDGQFAGLLADRCSDDVLGLLEIFHREILMNPVHDGVPEDLVVGVIGVAVHGGKVVVVVVAAPDCAGVIGRVAGEPDIFIIGSGSRFSCHGHIAERDQRSGSFGHDVLHGAGQKPGISLL